MDGTRALRLCGLAGVAASLCWLAGDILLLGARRLPEESPLLLERYRPLIRYFSLDALVANPEPRLAAGALLGALTSSLYLAGCWHFFLAARPGGTRVSGPALALLVVGFANAPLAHAAFYFAGALYQTIPLVPEAAHPALLDLGNRFFRVTAAPYLLAVGGIALGLTWLAVAAARGRTAWPRWMAFAVNPLSLIAVADLLIVLAPPPLDVWLRGAGISLATLAAFSLSTGVLWNGPRLPASPGTGANPGGRP